VISRRESGNDYIFKETASLDNGNGSPHEGDGASKENHEYATPHSTKKKIVSDTKVVRGKNGNLQ
jgi:hypothetical protein